MRKIIAIILAVMLIASMTIPAYAATIVPIGKTVSFKMPSIKVPDIPSSVQETIKTTIPSNFMNNWFKTYS